jgi:hypothetical protein
MKATRYFFISPARDELSLMKAGLNSTISSKLEPTPQSERPCSEKMH